jgi:hypothetical protein
MTRSFSTQVPASGPIGTQKVQKDDLLLGITSKKLGDEIIQKRSVQDSKTPKSEKGDQTEERLEAGEIGDKAKPPQQLLNAKLSIVEAAADETPSDHEQDPATIDFSPDKLSQNRSNENSQAN